MKLYTSTVFKILNQFNFFKYFLFLKVYVSFFYYILFQQIVI